MTWAEKVEKENEGKETEIKIIIFIKIT